MTTQKRRLGRPPIYATVTEKFSSRMPAILLRKASRLAKRDGYSLSQWIVAAMRLALRDPHGMRRELQKMEDEAA